MDLSIAIICNAKKKSEHCKDICLHGIPHVRNTDRDGQCFKNRMICTLSKGGMVHVECRLLNQEEKDYYNKLKFLKKLPKRMGR